MSGGVAGYEYARLIGENLIFGLLSAVVTCGAIALLVSCERYLHFIARDLEDRRVRERAVAGKPPHLDIVR
jgi:hypothetical protein